MLRTCARTSREGTMKVPSISLSVKSSCSLLFETKHSTVVQIIFQCHDHLVILIGAPFQRHWIPPSLKRTTNSRHLALVSNTSRADLDPVLQWISMGLLAAGVSAVARNLSNQVDTHAWNCSHGNWSRRSVKGRWHFAPSLQMKPFWQRGYWRSVRHQ